MLLQAGIDIHAPAALVFELISSPERLPAWNESVVDARRQDAGPVRLGSRAAMTGRVLGQAIQSVTEVVVYEPPRAFVTRSLSGPPAETRFQLEPMVDGCRLRVQLQARPPGGRLGESLAQRVMQPDLERSLARLRLLAEDEARRRAEAEPLEGGDPACWLHEQEHAD